MSMEPLPFPKFKWVEGNTALLKKRWFEDISAKQIGIELGCSRNSIIGKVHRLGLDGRSRDIARAAERKVNAGAVVNGIREKRQARRDKGENRQDFGTLQRLRNNGYTPSGTVEPRNASLAEFNAAIPKEQRKTLIELCNNDCRFPIGEPNEKDFFFCAAPKHEGYVYCTGHCRVAYRGPL